MMKIREIKLTPLSLRFKEPYHWAFRVDHGISVILVEVMGDDDLCGVGETTVTLPAEGSLALLQNLVSEFIGKPLFEIEPLVNRARFLAGAVRTPRASALLMAGVDMAMWDLAGKTLGLPVHRLLGGAIRQEVDYFVFPQGGTAEELASSARKAVVGGASVVYMKVGRSEVEDMENVAAVREAIGPDHRLRLDANGAWDVMTAVNMIKRLSVFNPEFIEQPTPVHNLQALRQVRERVEIPIAADQSVFTIDEIYEACRTQAVDVLVVSPHEVGGMMAFKKGAAIAEAAGLTVCLHGLFVSGVSDCAQHQVALNTPNMCQGNQIMHQLLREDIICSPNIDPVRGKLKIWETPGLGFELNRDAVARAAEDYLKNWRSLRMDFK